MVDGEEALVEVDAAEAVVVGSVDVAAAPVVDTGEVVPGSTEAADVVTSPTEVEPMVVGVESVTAIDPAVMDAPELLSSWDETATMTTTAATTAALAPIAIQRRLALQRRGGVPGSVGRVMPSAYAPTA